ncbi:hypothetical protein IW262DRAFT_1298866 [Armillaria fumosa]|nr:hypothetical protein IW262DRAFT_1298866 [Armillaria fumosa]
MTAAEQLPSVGSNHSGFYQSSQLWNSSENISTLGTVRMVKRAVLYPQWPGRTDIAVASGGGPSKPEGAINAGAGAVGSGTLPYHAPVLQHKRVGAKDGYPKCMFSCTRSDGVDGEKRRQDIGTPSGCATKREMRGRTEGNVSVSGHTPGFAIREGGNVDALYTPTWPRYIIVLAGTQGSEILGKHVRLCKTELGLTILSK